MKVQASCLLLLCSLTALCDDANVAAETKADSAPPAKSSLELRDKLDWNVKSEHWESLVDRKSFGDTASAISVDLAATGSSAADHDFTSSAGDSIVAAEEARIDRVLRKIEPRDGVRLGQSDVVFRSPILEGLVPRALPDDASLGEKILNLPVVRWFRPLPIPNPPGGGKYFMWGSRDKAWMEFSQPVSGPGRADNGM